jgi:hypothetical protein
MRSCTIKILLVSFSIFIARAKQSTKGRQPKQHSIIRPLINQRLLRISSQPSRFILVLNLTYFISTFLTHPPPSLPILLSPPNGWWCAKIGGWLVIHFLCSPLPLVICHVLRTGIYIASSPPLGHHHSLQYIQTHPLSTSTACPGRDIIRRRNYLLLLPYSTKTTILRRGA